MSSSNKRGEARSVTIQVAFLRRYQAQRGESCQQLRPRQPRGRVVVRCRRSEGNHNTNKDREGGIEAEAVIWASQVDLGG